MGQTSHLTEGTFMSHTITRPRRLAAGLVRMSGGSIMIITGTNLGDRASTVGGNPNVVVTSSTGPVAAGTGCQQQSGAAVLCTGVSSIRFSGGAGNDVFRNDTAVRSDQFGEAGNDQLIGGSGRDFLRGGGDADAAADKDGIDDCITEIESSTCEL